jgi:hypothetical protein
MSMTYAVSPSPKYSGLSSTSYLLKGPAAENEAWMPSQQCSGADKGDFATFQHGKKKRALSN